MKKENYVLRQISTDFKFIIIAVKNNPKDAEKKQASRVKESPPAILFV